jgi:DNA-binding NarL/FixJ family response regulator
MKRVVVVSDNPPLIGAIAGALRHSAAVALAGYLRPGNARTELLLDAAAELVLIDESDRDAPPVALIHALKAEGDVRVVLLAERMDGPWVSAALDAGADGAISKAVQPAAFATLLEAVSRGHLVHAPVDRGRAAQQTHSDLAHESLTERELEILRLLASGASNCEIGRRLWITSRTVKFHVSNVYRKLGVANRTEACHYAHVHGLVTERVAAARQPVAA